MVGHVQCASCELQGQYEDFSCKAIRAFDIEKIECEELNIYTGCVITRDQNHVLL